MRRTIAPVLALSLVVLVAACGDDAATTTASSGPVEIAVIVSGGTASVTVAGAASSDHVAVTLGSQVRLTVTSDVAGEVHLHTYDLMVDLEPGVPGSIDFTASIAGIFEVELEGSAFHLIDLEVS